MVEDNLPVLEVTQAMLERLGYRVLTTTSGRYALELYDQHQYNIVLVLADMIMPDIGGLALLHGLKKRHPGVKVLAMTGYPLGEGEVKELLAQGMAGWLQKPLNIEQLAQQLSKVVK